MVRDQGFHKDDSAWLSLAEVAQYILRHSELAERVPQENISGFNVEMADAFGDAPATLWYLSSTLIRSGRGRMLVRTNPWWM